MKCEYWGRFPVLTFTYIWDKFNTRFLQDIVFTIDCSLYMLTFIDKIVYKHKNNMPMTSAEHYFFSVKDILGIIRQLKNKRI